jgi:hypothetical protein
MFKFLRSTPTAEPIAVNVRITAIDLDVGQWIELIFKIMIASIPAAIMFGILWFIIGSVCFGALHTGR